MEAKLYLWDLNQDRIRTERMVSKEEIEKMFTPDDFSWVLCCDAFCCILDFSFRVDKLDEIKLKDLKERANFRWHIREEKFGGLLWNPQTGHVFQLDKEAYQVLRALEEGMKVEEVERKFTVSGSKIHSLLADISKKIQTPEHGERSKSK